MILNQAANIMSGALEVEKVCLGSRLIWQREHEGLAPWGTNWNLYGVQPCEYGYLSPGIHLKGLASTGNFMFTCAESPEKLDFTTIKSVRMRYSGIYGSSQVAGGLAAIPQTRQANPQTTISHSALQIARPENTLCTLDCRGIGGQQFLLLYADLDYTLNVTEITWESYPASHIADLSALTWEQRNYQYESNTVITCNAQIPVPADATEAAVHLSAHNGAALKSCMVFLDANGLLLGYGDGWQGNTPNGVTVSTHFQTLPSGTAYLQIAAGRAPDMTSAFTPQELASCVVCFS